MSTANGGGDEDGDKTCYFPGDQDTVNRKSVGTRDMRLQNTKRKLSEFSVLKISYIQGSTVESILS